MRYLAVFLLFFIATPAFAVYDVTLELNSDNIRIFGQIDSYTDLLEYQNCASQFCIDSWDNAGFDALYFGIYSPTFEPDWYILIENRAFFGQPFDVTINSNNLTCGYSDCAFAFDEFNNPPFMPATPTGYPWENFIPTTDIDISDIFILAGYISPVEHAWDGAFLAGGDFSTIVHTLSLLPATPTINNLTWGSDYGFFGQSTPAQISASVIEGVQDTGANLWPLLIFLGVSLAFIIFVQVVALTRHTTRIKETTRRKNAVFNDNKADELKEYYSRDGNAPNWLVEKIRGKKDT